MQEQGLINPNHEVEYTYAELSAKLRTAGFVIEQACGLNYGGAGIGQGRFSMAEMSANTGMFHDVEDCCLLVYVCAYVCRKPSR